LQQLAAEAMSTSSERALRAAAATAAANTGGVVVVNPGTDRAERLAAARSRVGDRGCQAGSGNNPGSGKHNRRAARGVGAVAQGAVTEPGAAPDPFAVA